MHVFISVPHEAPQLGFIVRTRHIDVVYVTFCCPACVRASISVICKLGGKYHLLFFYTVLYQISIR